MSLMGRQKTTHIPRKPINFQPAGPFSLKVEKMRYGRTIDDKALSAFWKTSKVTPFAQKVGCYIFAMGNKPYYVGKATKSFKQELFSSKNLATYRRVVAEAAGKARIYFVAHRKLDGQKGARPTKVISQVEKLLIGMAHEANPDLENVQHLNKEDRFVIVGVYNSGRGKPSQSARLLRSALKLTKK
jgi:hypothetical protein